MRVVDLFAGAGGFSEGAYQAGCEVLWAANHWPLAVEVHADNHGTTHHECQDLHQADWYSVPDHDIMLASPSCQGHSKARGREEDRHDTARATAWAVVSAAEVKRPRAILVENVPEFYDWTLFSQWVGCLHQLGYNTCNHVFDAADFGVPQNRERAFLTAHYDGPPIVLDNPKLEHRPAADFLNFMKGNWSVIDKPGRSLNTLARIQAGRQTHGEQFLAPYYGSGSGKTGRSLDRPIGTITTKARWSLINGKFMRMLTVEEQMAAMGFPDNYILPKAAHKAIHLLGNAVCPPVAKCLIEQIMEKLRANN